MTTHSDDRNTIDMFQQPSRGRPRTSPYDRAMQTKISKRQQRLRDKHNGLHRVEIKLHREIIERLDDHCEHQHLSRTEVIEQALKAWIASTGEQMDFDL